jgi:hypothetical protein
MDIILSELSKIPGLSSFAIRAKLNFIKTQDGIPNDILSNNYQEYITNKKNIMNCKRYNISKIRVKLFKNVIIIYNCTIESISKFRAELKNINLYLDEVNIMFIHWCLELKYILKNIKTYCDNKKISYDCLSDDSPLFIIYNKIKFHLIPTGHKVYIISNLNIYDAQKFIVDLIKKAMSEILI